MNRRNFLIGAGATAAGTMLLPKMASALFSAPKQHAIGVQLFTFFGIIEADVPGTLKKIAGIGYTEIESAFSKLPHYYGTDPKGFAAMCKDAGLSWRSHHVLGGALKLPKGAKLPAGFPDHIPNLKEDTQALVDQAAEGGISYLVCANIPTGTLDEIKEANEILNKAGEACKKVKIQLCYHNHDMEFKEVEGKVPYHLMLEGLDPKLVKMELDLAWATKAGVNVVELFKAHPGRFPLLHVKDITKEGQLEPVGEGIVDFKDIFANTKVAGVQHYFVEHDMPKDAFASITTSYKNLRSMGI
ncbi:MAG: TIM barrel protein [Bacteroidetes bacterium]|nr:TIM barrel protein [Bacteroidota bacterium]